MSPVLVIHRIALLAGGAAIIGMGMLTACGSSTKEAPTPSNSPSATTSAPSLSPTEKGTVKPIPSIEDRGAMDSHSCLPGQVKYNGVCQ